MHKLFTGVALLATVSSAYAFDFGNDPDLTNNLGGIFSNPFSSDGSYPFAQATAENLDLAQLGAGETYQLDTIKFWGGSDGFNSGDDTNTTGFEITFFDDNSGVPGSVTNTFSFNKADTNAVEVGTWNNAGQQVKIYEYTANFVSPVDLGNGGNTVWVSIGGILASQTAADDLWVWNLATGGDDLYAEMFDNGNNTAWSGNWGTQNDNLAVRFQGEAVPEPATLTLLGLGALAALKRKKKS